MEPEPWGVGRSRRAGAGKASSLLLVPRVRKGKLRPGVEADGVGRGLQPASGSPGPRGLTWKRGTAFPALQEIPGVGGRRAGASFRRVGGADPSRLPSCAQRGLAG